MRRWYRRILLPLLLLAVILVATSSLFAAAGTEAEASAIPAADAGAACTVASPALATSAIDQASDEAAPVAVVSGQEVGQAGSSYAAASATCYLVGWRIFINGCGDKDLYVLRYLCYDPAKGWYYVTYYYCY